MLEFEEGQSQLRPGYSLRRLTLNLEWQRPQQYRQIYCVSHGAVSFLLKQRCRQTDSVELRKALGRPHVLATTLLDRGPFG